MKNCFISSGTGVCCNDNTSFFSPERPLHGAMKLWPLIHEWQNWSREYSAQSCLCVKSNDLAKRIETAVSQILE